MNTSSVPALSVENLHAIRTALLADDDRIARLTKKTGKSKEEVETAVLAFVSLTDRQLAELSGHLRDEASRGDRLELTPRDCAHLKAGMIPALIVLELRQLAHQHGQHVLGQIVGVLRLNRVPAQPTVDERSV